MFGAISERLSKALTNIPRGSGIPKEISAPRAAAAQTVSDSVSFSPEALDSLEGQKKSRSPFSTALRTEYAQAKGDKDKLKTYSDKVWNQMAELEKNLTPAQKEAINRDYKAILGTYQRNQGDLTLNSVSPTMADKIRAKAPGDPAQQGQMAQGIYAIQKEEHEGMAHALALRHNSSGDLRQLTNGYLHSRNDLNGLRGLNTLITPDVQLGK